MKSFNQPFYIRLGLLFLALLITLSSVLYTNNLVSKLKERETKLVDLYAKAIQNAALPENAGSLGFLFEEIIHANNSIPVILSDAKGNPLSYKNIDVPEEYQKDKLGVYLEAEIKKMKSEYQPIVISFGPKMKNYVFYKNSALLYELKFFPIIQIVVVFIFVLLGYFVINHARNSEQNKVWVGMAKETAHQLGTPISSLMAWTEIFKIDANFSHPEAVIELEKDITRLETITARFSSIGSVPILKNENLIEVLKSTLQYLDQRTSKKVIFLLKNNTRFEKIELNLNKPLFEWSIENIIKNAVDAMVGVGNLTVIISEIKDKKVVIDIKDTGKGIPKQNLKTIFKPGFTTKQRGWGLGLTLTKRIIEEYHKGKIFVKYSEIGVGTTFRIIINFKEGY
jgi:two-component system, sporulation sensor kinase E